MKENSLIWVPSGLLNAAERDHGNIRKIESCLLFWHLVDSWPYVSNGGWRQINNEFFRAVTSRPHKIRSWLEESQFLKIRKWERLDGELVNHYRPGKESCKYKTLTAGSELIQYTPSSRPPWGYGKGYTEDDFLCMRTRVHIGLLRHIDGKMPEYADKTEEKRKKNRAFSSVSNLRCNTGSVKRGYQVRRLFSPWATCPREVRACFLLDGDEICSCDLKAAHPVLIASLSGDAQLAQDCVKDVFYQRIAILLSKSRDEAKKAFMAYAYGKNRADGRGNPDAYLVQQWMKAEYPKAAGYVTYQKSKSNHEQFSIDLQNLEADIFVDGIFRELDEASVPSLTVHDAIYFSTRDRNRVEEVTHKHLERRLGEGRYRFETEGSR